MTAYAAFLRGINLGPTNKVAMPALRALAERLGYGDVRTYLNSGNLLFTSADPAATLERELASALRAEFGRTIDVTVRTRAQLEQILAANPFPDGDPSRVTVAFLAGPPPPDAGDRIAARAQEHEPFVVADTEVYVHYGHGQAGSTLAARFSTVVGVSATVRNLRTVAKITELSAR